MVTLNTIEAPLDRFQIKAEIARRGLTLTGLARKYGLGDSAIRVALGKRYPRADKVVSDFLDISLHELWPDRYDQGGKKISFMAKPSKSAPRGQH